MPNTKKRKKRQKGMKRINSRVLRYGRRIYCWILMLLSVKTQYIIKSKLTFRKIYILFPTIIQHSSSRGRKVFANIFFSLLMTHKFLNPTRRRAFFFGCTDSKGKNICWKKVSRTWKKLLTMCIYAWCAVTQFTQREKCVFLCT